jgi:cytochrome P450
MFDPRYKDDDLTVSKPFSQGLRGCPGGAISMAVVRLFMAKVLWQFDIEEVPTGSRLGRRTSFERDFKWFSFWESPPYWVRFVAAQDRADI